MKKLAIITTHPIQYNAPWFRLLAERGRMGIKVFYTWSQVENQKKFDPGFGKPVTWDIPLLDGYDYVFVQNTSANPGSKSYKGIQNPTLIAEVEAWKPDAILIFGWKFKSHLRALRHFHGKIPVLFRGDSHMVGRHSGLKNILRRRVLHNVFRNIDYALYVGTENRTYFRKAGLEDQQLIHMPHAVDNERFRTTAKTISQGMAYRQQLNIPQHDLVFLFAGKFEPVKNPMLLLDVARNMEGRHVHFVFAGNGPLEADMKSMASDHIHFLDFQNQQSMPGLYQMCDVYILPSLSETWGLAVNEAMASGKPVLISDQCGCAPDLVIQGKTGLTFRSGNADDLKSKILSMISDSNKWKGMEIQILELIQAFSFENNAHILEDIFDKRLPN